MAQRAKTLEEYLSEDYNRDVEDIRAIESTLAAIASMYVATFDRRKGSWPYQISAGANIVRGERSHGTSAMILSALGKTIGQCTLRSNRKPERVPDLPKELPAIFKKGLKTSLWSTSVRQKKHIENIWEQRSPYHQPYLRSVKGAACVSKRNSGGSCSKTHTNSRSSDQKSRLQRPLRRKLVHRCFTGRKGSQVVCSKCIPSTTGHKGARRS